MTTWRVLTWNLHGASRPNLDVIAKVIDGYAPDIVALQEVRHAQTRGLARRLQWRAAWTRKHHPYSPLVWWRTEGLALLTPHAIAEMSSASISTGVSTWTFRHRVAMAVTVARGTDHLRVGNTHLATHGPDERIAQARRTVEIVGDRRPVVVAGDLNAVDEVEVIREFATLGLVDPGGEPSSPSISPTTRLDYVLVPEDASVTARLTPEGGEQWRELSDHLPVLVELIV
jgi:endonuclease/exonuclease/phosphatase family metal-dependent hydrolase